MLYSFFDSFPMRILGIIIVFISAIVNFRSGLRYRDEYLKSQQASANLASLSRFILAASFMFFTGILVCSLPY